MFDNIIIKISLPLNQELSKLELNWSEEVFQTKDLENLLDTYEITPEGRLRHLVQNREWKKDENPTTPMGGHLELISEHWEDVSYHGVVSFYTSYCDKPNLDNDLLTDPEKMSWEEIFQTEGNDWWIEFLAIFDDGHTREIRLHKVEKTAISARLARNKEWCIKREMKENKMGYKIIRRLRKIPGYNILTRKISRIEQKCHEKVSAGIRWVS